MTQPASLSDEELLLGYCETGDASLFSELVHRYERELYSYLRRYLGDAEMAEDAFQATFLVLARKAATVVPREFVANWLYGVAYRTAQKARVSRARANAVKGGYANVEFRLGEIEHLPVPDASVDVIVSNCVVNLSPEKDRVFREAYRVLKPGGRMLVSDLVLEQPLPKETRESIEAYVGCIAGASLRGDYLQFMRDAGFQEVEVVREGRYGADPVTSVQVRALKP